jgi:hypothetical protein
MQTLLSKFIPILVLVSCVGLKAQDQGPRISCPEEVWDLGQVPQGQEYKHKFVVQNIGNSQLEIRQVVPSCQCAAAMPERNRLEPSEETYVEVSLRTLTYTGNLHKTVTIQSNDATKPQVQLQIRAEVMPPYYVVPATLELGSFSKAEASKRVPFKIIISRGSTVTIKGMTPTSELLKLEAEGSWEEAADGTKSKTYYVQYAKGAPVGLLRESIWIDTDLAVKPRINLVAVGSVEGEVTVSPATLNLGRVKPGDSVTTPFIVSKTGAADLIVDEVTANPSGVFEAAFKELEKGRKYEVTLKIAADAKRGFQKGTITVRTNVEGEHVVQAYFYAFVEK